MPCTSITCSHRFLEGSRLILISLQIVWLNELQHNGPYFSSESKLVISCRSCRFLAEHFLHMKMRVPKIGLIVQERKERQAVTLRPNDLCGQMHMVISVFIQYVSPSKIVLLIVLLFCAGGSTYTWH